MSEFHGCNACGSPENWEKLLKEAHDQMDDMNTHPDTLLSMAQLPRCNWCRGEGYDANGMKHDEDCILVKIRHVIHT